MNKILSYNVGQIISIIFLSIFLPFLYSNATLDPVFHIRFLSWTIFLLFSMIILMKREKSNTEKNIVIQKYHLLLVSFVFISLLDKLKILAA